MRRHTVHTICALTILFATLSCRAVEPPKERPAGSFYPADPAQLAAFIDDQISRATVPEIGGTIVALVAPHAGYSFSGPVAAHSFALLRGKKYKRVILIGPSHYELIRYSSVFDGEAYTTPLGKVMVDRDFVRRLAAPGHSIKLSAAGHLAGTQAEHCLEVELPFLQRTLGDFKIVPIIMGDQSYQASRDLGMALAKLLRDDPDTLLLASSDLSHYHPYDEAVRKDHNLLDGISHNDFLSLSHNLESDVWEACGGAPIVAVMIAAQHLGGSTPRLLKYANSGDTSGDKSRVVGYAAIVITKGSTESRQSGLSLTDAERAELLKIARTSVETAVREHRFYEPPVPQLETLRLDRGAFVTLTKKGELRGCVGYGSPMMPLYLTVRDVAAFAALKDTRFPPVKPEELSDLQYEISVLSPFQHVIDPKAVEVGQHGIIVRKGSSEGYLLPQVPVEFHWDRTTFLQEGSVKAGLDSNAWQDADTDLFTFTAVVFSDHDSKSKK